MKTLVKIFKYSLPVTAGVVMLIPNSSLADNPPPCTCDCAPYEGSDQYEQQAAVLTQSSNGPVEYGHNDTVGIYYTRATTTSDIGCSESIHYEGKAISNTVGDYRYLTGGGYAQDVYSRDWMWSGPPGSDPGATGSYSVSGHVTVSAIVGNHAPTTNTSVASQAWGNADVGVWPGDYIGGSHICTFGLNATISGLGVYAVNNDTGGYADPGSPGDPYYGWVTYGSSTNLSKNSAAATGGGVVSMGRSTCVGPGSLGFGAAALCYVDYGMSIYAENDDPGSYAQAFGEVDTYAGIRIILSMSRCD